MTAQRGNNPTQTQPIDEILSIIQYNVHASDTVMIPFLHKAAKEGRQILAIQEPYLNKTTKGTTTHPDYWVAIQATGKARTCFFILKTLHQSIWHVHHHSDDIATLKLQLKDRTIHIHNIYNPSPHTTQPTAAPTLAKVRDILQEEEQESILLGDFNLHNPLWNAPTRNSYHGDSEKLIDITAESQMTLTTPQGTITWEKGELQTTLDLAFITPGIYPALVKCSRVESLEYGSDHFPICTSMLTATLQKADNKRRQWKRANWEALKKHITETLKAYTGPKTRQEIDVNIIAATKAIQEAVDLHVPWAKPSPRANPAWSKEVEELVKEARRARRKATSGNPWDIRRYHTLNNTKKRALRRGRSFAWRSFAAEVSKGHGLWRMTKWAKTKADQPQTTPQFPPLQQSATEEPTFDNTIRTQILAKKFFPPPEAADLADIEHTIYPQPVLVPQEVTEAMIRAALKKMHPDKAPGPDGIINRILKECLKELLPVLVPTFNMCAKLGYHPKPFREGCTIAIRKPGKPSYTVAAGYRPIMLLNTMGKLLEAVIATEISRITEEYQLLPETQMGARPGKSTLTALTLATELIHSTWQLDPFLVISMLNLDLAGAFDKVVHDRVLHCLRARRVPEWIVLYITSFLSERTTTIKYGEYTSEHIAVKSGIPQGSTLSPILFLYFAADLIDILNQGEGFAFGFVDDTSLMAVGQTTGQTTRLLTEAHEKCIKWAEKHGAKFEPDKYKLIHFTRRPNKHNLSATVTIPGFSEGPVPSLRMLGVILDTKLTWKPHIAFTLDKMKTVGNALSRLTASTWGASLKKGKHIYTAAVRPVITYGSGVWHTPTAIKGHSKANTTKLKIEQNKHLRVITGAYRATPVAELEHEAGIPPIDIHLDSQVLGFQTSQATTTAAQTISKECKRVKNRVWRANRARPALVPTPHTAKKTWAKKEIEKSLEGSQHTWATATKGERKRCVQEYVAKQGKGRWEEYRHKRRSHTTAAQGAKWDAKIDQWHTNLTKAQSALAIQIRTEKIGFQDFLYRMRVPDVLGPWCECRRGIQTAKHIIEYCSKYSHQRNRIHQAAGTADYNQLISSQRGLEVVTRWIIQEGMLPQFSRAKELLMDLDLDPDPDRD